MVVAKVPKSDWFKLEKSFSASVSCGQSKRNHYFHQHEKFHDRLIYYYYFVSIAKNFVAESMNREVRCFGWHTPEYQLIELANETRIFTIKIERIQHFILRIFIRLASLLSLTFLLVVFFVGRFAQYTEFEWPFALRNYFLVAYEHTICVARTTDGYEWKQDRTHTYSCVQN